MKRIFVSSTFRDMQYERDLFHTVITPKLNAYAREYGESVSFCDLRWGVNTSELESEDGARKVLSVCLNEIDRCDRTNSMPYIVVLIGNRYGWIPERKLIEDAASRKEFYLSDLEKSVTALEIEYGALRDEEHIARTLFYFREFDEELPSDSKYGIDGETEIEKSAYQSRLDALKDRIRKLTNERVKTYYVTLDEDGEKIHGLDKFSDMVVDDIRGLMEDDWKKYAIMPLYEKINQVQWNIAEEKAMKFAAFQDQASKIIEELLMRNSKTIYGKASSGKTTMMAHIAITLRDSGYDVIPIFGGSLSELDSKDEIYRHIIYLVENRLDKQHNLDIQQLNSDELCNTCVDALVRFDRESKEKLVILLDTTDKYDFNLFKKSNSESYHPVAALRYAEFRAFPKLRALDWWDTSIVLRDMNEQEKIQTIQTYLSNLGKEISEEVVERIIIKESSNNIGYMTLLLMYLDMLGKEDFDRIKTYGDDSKAIDRYMREMIESFPDNYESAFDYIYSQIGSFLGNDVLKGVEYIALHRNGMEKNKWQEYCFQNNVHINEMVLTLFINYFDGWFGIDDNNYFRVLNDTCRKSILIRIDDKALEYERLINFYADLPNYKSVEIAKDVLPLMIYHKAYGEFVSYINVFYGDEWNKICDYITLVLKEHFETDDRVRWLGCCLRFVQKENCDLAYSFIWFLQQKIYDLFVPIQVDEKIQLMDICVDILEYYFESIDDIRLKRLLSISDLKLGRLFSTRAHEKLRVNNSIQVSYQVVGSTEVLFSDLNWEKAQRSLKKSYDLALYIIEIRGDEWDYRDLDDILSAQHDLYYKMVTVCADDGSDKYRDICNKLVDTCENMINFSEEACKKYPQNSALQFRREQAYLCAYRLCPVGDITKKLLYMEKYFQFNPKTLLSILDEYRELKKKLKPGDALLPILDEKIDRLNTEVNQNTKQKIDTLLSNAFRIHTFNSWEAYANEIWSYMLMIKKQIDKRNAVESACEVWAEYEKAYAQMIADFPQWNLLYSERFFYKLQELYEFFTHIFLHGKKIELMVSCLKQYIEMREFEFEQILKNRAVIDVSNVVKAYCFAAKTVVGCENAPNDDAVVWIEYAHNLMLKFRSPRNSFFLEFNDFADLYVTIGDSLSLEKAITYCYENLRFNNSDENKYPLVHIYRILINAYEKLNGKEHLDKIVGFYDIIIDLEIWYLNKINSDPRRRQHYNPGELKHAIDVAIARVDKILSRYDELNDALYDSKYYLWMKKYFDNVHVEDYDVYFEIGKLFCNEHPVTRSYEKAQKWFLMSAECNYSMAQKELGDFYYYGYLGNADATIAYEWYLKAAKQGIPNAQYMTACLLHLGQGVEKNDAKAVEWFKKAADNGSIDAMASLGAFYMNGIGVDNDYSQSLKYLSEACKYDHSLAQHNMAVLYWNGWGVERDYQVAISWFEKAAKNGNKDAQKTLAKIYKEGIHVTKNLVKSFEWYLKLAENNDIDAQKETGENFYYGRGVAVNYEEALRWYLKAAQNGNMLAQYSTGYCYHYGKGCTQDPAKAFEWYLKAAEQGGLSSQCEVGHAYYYGRGISQSYEKAIEWYQKSAEGGYKSRQYALAMCYKNGKGVVQDHSKSFEWFMKAAVQGSAASQNEIGEAYFYGHGVDVCYEKALEWYLKSAKNGNSSAQFNSGYCYRYGKGCEVDYVKAFEWFMRAAEQGSASAECEVGHAYYYGRGVEKSYEKAVEWYQKAADRGNKAAQYALGLCYKNGLGTDKDYTKALNGFMKVAVQGHASSQDEVGIAYYYGRGTTKDHNEAFKWFTKSAESGCSSGQYDLGVCYKNGIGTEQDYTKAFNWFMKAAVQGHAASQDNVGDAYYYGRGVESDYDKAFEWYMKSAQNGNASAQFDVGYCYKNGIGTEQDYAKAFEWFMKSADRGMAYSQCEVGYAYYFGRGVDQSYEKAAQYFLNAAQRGYAEAQKNIGTCYEEGTGVEKNLEQAIFWYQKATEQGDENAKKALENINSKKEE